MCFISKSGDAPGKGYFPGGNGTVAPIDPGDVVVVAAAGHEGKTYELTWQELHTIEDMAQSASRALGKSIRLQVSIPGC